MKHIGPISGIAAHAAHFVATAGYDNQVILWNATTGEPIHRVHHDHLANQCAFSSDGKHLVSASSDYTARIWEVPSMRLKAVLQGHNDDVEMAVFSPDSQRVATCSRDHVLRIFDLDGVQLQAFHGHQADVISVVWSPDGQRLISSSDDGTVRQWDTRSGQQCDEVDIGGVETDTIAITREGVVFAGDDEGRISIIADGQVQTVPAHAAGIKRIVWNDDKRLLVSLSYDRSAILWTFDAGRNLVKRRSTALPSIVWPRSCAFVGDEQLVFATFGSRYATWNYEQDQWQVSGIEPAVSINAVVRSEERQYSIPPRGKSQPPRQYRPLMLRIRRRQLRTRVDQPYAIGAQAQRQIVNRIGVEGHLARTGGMRRQPLLKTHHLPLLIARRTGNHSAIAAVHHLNVNAQRLLDAQLRRDCLYQQADRG